MLYDIFCNCLNKWQLIYFFKLVITKKTILIDAEAKTKSHCTSIKVAPILNNNFWTVSDKSPGLEANRRLFPWATIAMCEFSRMLPERCADVLPTREICLAGMSPSRSVKFALPRPKANNRAWYRASEISVEGGLLCLECHVMCDPPVANHLCNVQTTSRQSITR